MCFQRSQVFRQDSPLPPRWPVGNRRQQLLRDIVTEERHGPQLQHGGAPCLEAFRTAAMWHCEPPKPSGLEESFEKSPTLTAAQLPLQIHPEVRYSVILHHPQTSHPTEGRSQCPPQRCSPAAPSQPGCPQRRFGAILPSAPRTRRVSASPSPPGSAPAHLPQPLRQDALVPTAIQTAALQLRPQIDHAQLAQPTGFWLGARRSAPAQRHVFTLPSS